MATSRKPVAAPAPAPKLPKTLGGIVDLLFSLQSQREAFEAQAAAIKKQEAVIAEYLSTNFDKEKLDGAFGKDAVAEYRPQEVPEVEDWDLVYAYIKRNNAFELLHKRLGVTAVKERWEDGKTIPGVTKKEFRKLVVKARA